MRHFFLSASIPLESRPGGYHKTADVIAIRDAVRAIGVLVAAEGVLVFGGHPAITPLLATTIEALGASCRERIKLYQSSFYETAFIEDNKKFSNVIVVERKPSVEASLMEMRVKMLTDHDFDAAFFVGGMNGVEAEFDLISELRPKANCFPLPATGGAAAKIYQKKEFSNEHSWLQGRSFFSIVNRALSEPPKPVPEPERYPVPRF